MKITDQGVKYLSQMLKTNHTLTQLWLGFNHISDDGVKLLMNILTYHNKTLQVFIISIE